MSVYTEYWSIQAEEVCDEKKNLKVCHNTFVRNVVVMVDQGPTIMIFSCWRIQLVLYFGHPSTNPMKRP